MKYILMISKPDETHGGRVEDTYYTFHYYDDLIGIYQHVCRDLLDGFSDDNEMDIEDITNYYDSIDERVSEHEAGYFIVEMGGKDPIISLGPEVYNDLSNGWDRFSKFCFSENESFILTFNKFKN